MQFAGTFAAAEMPDRSLRELAGTEWRRRQGLSLPAVELPSDVVGVCGESLTRGYLLYGPDFGRRVAYLRPTDVQSLRQALDREGVTVLAGRPTPLLREAVQKGVLVRDIGLFYRVLR